jgi:hypothetical protein
MLEANISSSTLATGSFCKCRANNKPDNDITNWCCTGMEEVYNIGLKTHSHAPSGSPHPDYSSSNGNQFINIPWCVCSGEDLYNNFQTVWSTCCKNYGDTYNCEIG